MAIQYLIVRFPERRQVIVDGLHYGETGELLELVPGTYIISLEPAEGCFPPSQTVQMTATTALRPGELTFTLVRSGTLH